MIRMKLQSVASNQRSSCHQLHSCQLRPTQHQVITRLAEWGGTNTSYPTRREDYSAVPPLSKKQTCHQG